MVNTMSLVRVIKEHNILAEASRDYYKKVDALIVKHGEEKAFRYKSPMNGKLITDIKKLMKDEKEHPQSQKTCTVIMKNLNAGIEMMGYEDTIVMTEKQHNSMSKDFDGDTMFREDLAKILMQDDIMSYAIFGE
jgi:hypothetical protein